MKRLLKRLLTLGLCGLATAALVACSGPAQNQPEPKSPSAKTDPATQPVKPSAGKDRPLPPLKGPPTTRPALPPPPKPKPKPKLPTGSLARADIQRVIQQNVKRVQRCYERQLLVNPRLAGRLIVNFTIAVDGSVQDATIDHSTIKNAAVGRCLVAEIESWTFPKPRGGVVKIKYPFVFRAQKP